MPWNALSDVPARVRQHRGAQMTLEQANWVAQVADALVAEGADEGDAWAQAWARFAARYVRRGRRWALLHADAGDDLALFVSDAGGQPVVVRQVQGAARIEGLPLMRVGRWNGRDYTAADLAAMARNHERLAREEHYQPALKSRHTYSVGPDGHLQPDNVDAAATTLGWIEGLRYDEVAETLLADVRAVDDDLVVNMRRGKLRYVSAEVHQRYATAGGEEIGPTLIGAAWVDRPAVRNLPWEIVINRADLGALTAWGPTGPGGDPGDVPGDSDDDGGGLMSTLIGRIAEVLTRLAAGEATEADVEQLAAEGDDAQGADVVGVADETVEAEEALAEEAGDEVQSAADEAGDAPGDVDALRDAGIARQVEQLRRSLQEREAEVATLRAEAQQQAAEAFVNELVGEGVLPPAQRQHLYVLAEALAGPGQVVTLAAADGATTEERPALTVLRDLLRAVAPERSFGRLRGNILAAADGDPQAPAAYDNERLSRIAALAGGRTEVEQ